MTHDADIERYKRICATETPYPISYMAHGDGRQQIIAAMIGMCIEKGILKRGFAI